MNAPGPSGATLDPHALAELRRVFAGAARPALAAIVHDFLESGPRRLREIADALGRRDVEALCWAAQALAGAARLLGARELAEACSTLEDAGRDGSWAHLPALADALAARHDQVRRLVEDEFGMALESGAAQPRHASEGED
jgi:HPt (histidine-containing phosphotransfer) domain-containing protein